MSGQVATHPVSDSQRLLISVALSIATFMQALDSSIANVAIPTICGDLGVSTTQGTWIITSFSVSLAIAVPLTGWLSRRIGEVRLFVIAVALFTLASWGCGLANNLPTLIFFRVLQGAMAGPITPMAQTLLLSVYPPDKKGTALGLFSVTVLLAPVFGPLLGGWITDHISWPWVFFINVPIGMLCAYSCWMLLRKRETTIVKDPIDKMGLALTVVGVGALQIMFDQGRELDWFNSPQIILLAIVAAIALTALIIWELTAEHPIINLRLFGDRNFTVGTIAISLAFSLYMGIVVIQPLWLQTNMGYTASWAGLSMAPNGILAIFLMPLVGHYLPRLNMRLVVMLSIGIYALSCFLRVRFSSDISFGYLLLPQWLQGIAHAGVLIPLSALILSTISPQNIASAAGLTAFCRTLTTSLGTSLSTTLWDRRASVHYITYTEHISPYSSAFMNSAYSKIPNGYAMIEKVIGSQAYFASFIDLCWLYGWLFLLVAPIVWIAKKPKIGSAPVVVD